MEVLRQTAWQEDVPSVFHFRDRDRREVDLVLERRDGSVAGIEVKTAASVTTADFRGWRHLRDKLGDRFKQGVVLYTGERALPFGDRLAAVPISGLWAYPA
jgi:predicted AAA+ superfamily ATPase